MDGAGAMVQAVSPLLHVVEAKMQFQVSLHGIGSG
jgi:hypothetical protein